MEPKAYPLEVVLHFPLLDLPGERRTQIAKEDARMPARVLYRQFTFSLLAPDSLQTGHVVGCFSLRLPRTEFRNCVISSKIACSTLTGASYVAGPTQSPLHRRSSIFSTT